MKRTKKAVAVLLAVFIFAAALQLGTLLSYADTSFDEGEFRFTVVSDNSILVSKYYGDSTEVTLPATGGGRAVKGVYSRCFENTAVESVIIPEGYTTIGAFAFNGCQSLSEVSLPSSLTSIGIMAFYDCSSLEGIDFSALENLSAISFAAFQNCGALESAVLPDSLTSLGENAFCDCASLGELYIPKNLNTIPEYAFYGCTALQSVFVPDTVTEIGENAFAPMDGEGTLSAFCFKDTAAEAYFTENEAPDLTAAEKIAGDANLDGTLNVNDVTEIQQYAAEYIGFNPLQLVLANCDGDAEVGISDATLIQMYLAEYNVVLG